MVRHKPIVVTEDPADEEFREFEHRKPALATGGVVDNTVKPRFVVGGRTDCEAVRGDHERNRVPTMGPCSGPHYFERTGPPGLVPTRGYNIW